MAASFGRKMLDGYGYYDHHDHHDDHDDHYNPEEHSGAEAEASAVSRVICATLCHKALMHC